MDKYEGYKRIDDKLVCKECGCWVADIVDDEVHLMSSVFESQTNGFCYDCHIKHNTKDLVFKVTIPEIDMTDVDVEDIIHDIMRGVDKAGYCCSVELSDD